MQCSSFISIYREEVRREWNVHSSAPLNCYHPRAHSDRHLKQHGLTIVGSFWSNRHIRTTCWEDVRHIFDNAFNVSMSFLTSGYPTVTSQLFRSKHSSSLGGKCTGRYRTSHLTRPWWPTDQLKTHLKHLQ